MKQRNQSDANQSKVHPAKAAADTDTVYDCTGYPVPKRALDSWLRSGFIEGMVEELKLIERRIGNLRVQKDKRLHEVPVKALMADLHNSIIGLQRGVPYAVCYHCSGQLPDGCKECGGLGTISVFAYNNIPIELREMRKKLSRK